MPVCAIPCTSLFCTYQCIAPPTLVQAYVGIGWEFDRYFSSINYPTPGGSSCNQKAHQSHVLQVLSLCTEVHYARHTSLHNTHLSHISANQGYYLSCLSSVVNGQNLIYSLPTSGGKTLVAELIIFRQLLLKNKNVLFILVLVYVSW